MEISESTIMDLELSINNLIQQKGKLVFDKKENEVRNSVLKNKVRSSINMSSVEYNNICKEQNKIKKDTLDIERAIGDISMEIMKKSTMKDQLRIEFKKNQKADVNVKLIELRDYYIQFASDKTRVSSMRAMGAEFAGKIEYILKSI